MNQKTTVREIYEDFMIKNDKSKTWDYYLAKEKEQMIKLIKFMALFNPNNPIEAERLLEYYYNQKETV